MVDLTSAMENKTEQHQAIIEYLKDYHASGGFISPVHFRRLSGLGLTSYINGLPGKTEEEDIGLALGKYNSYLERLALHKESSAAKSAEAKTSPDPPLPPTIIEGSLTKKSIAAFLQWSSTRYNNYLGYGTKQENVNLVFNALTAGHHKGETEFTIQCASATGENITKKSNRYWKTKGRGGDDYTINCQERTIRAKYRNQILQLPKLA